MDSVKELFNNGKINRRKCNEIWLAKNNLLQPILDQTKFLDESNCGISLRIRCIAENVTEWPRCRCGNPVLILENRLFRNSCSRVCSLRQPEVILKRIEKMNYGDIVSKSDQTRLDRYGVKSTFQCPKFIQKRKETWVEKYGSEHPFQNEIIIQKRRNTRLESNKPNKRRSDVNNDPQIIILLEQKLTPIEVANKLGISHTTVYNYLHRNNLFNKYCDTGNRSKAEIQINEFVNNLGFFTETSRRNIIPNNKEIDIFIPDKKLAIEYNGVYRHSQKNSLYHLNKTVDCNNLCIDLIHVFEHNWITKRNIVKSIIKSKLGVNNRIFARKLQLVELSSSISNNFLNENHIQGGTNALIHLGLELNGNLVAAMTFSSSRFDKKYEWELVRYASLVGTNIVGGAGKLLKYFERKWKPKSLMSYCDRSRGNGNLYKQLGFTFDSNTVPGYFYVKKNTFEILSRYQGQKHKLKDLLNNFNPLLTGEENMTNNGWYKIWDCGNSKWVKIYG